MDETWNNVFVDKKTNKKAEYILKWGMKFATFTHYLLEKGRER